MSRFTVQVEARFESAHFLRSYHGGPEPLHGHSYKVTAEIARLAGDLDREEQLSVYFVTATKDLERIAARLDYKCINDVPPFDKLSPTAENIATWVHAELTAALIRHGAEVLAISVWEGPFNSVRYTP